MEKLVVIGGGGHAKVILDMAEENAEFGRCRLSLARFAGTASTDGSGFGRRIPTSASGSRGSSQGLCRRGR